MEDKQEGKKRVWFVAVLLVSIVIFLFILNFVTTGVTKTCPKCQAGGSFPAVLSDSCKQGVFSSGNSTKVIMYLPAIDNDGNGSMTMLSVEASKGSGRTLTEIDNLLFWTDTQQSIRIARRVAENISNINLDNYDLVYTIKAKNASAIGGPSAGAALVIATIAAVENRQLKPGVVMTGAINHDGTIGKVSDIPEKAKAARDFGAKLFLVPLYQSEEIGYESVDNCEDFGGSKVCTTESRPQKINVTSDAGIEIKEVSSIQEAMGYFFE